MHQRLSHGLVAVGLGALTPLAAAGGTDFIDCGQLVSVSGCPTLFQDSQGFLHLLDDTGGYFPGDQVEVAGSLTTCSVPCGATGSCVIGATLLPCSPGPPGTPFCFGDGTAGACPCGNQSPLGSEAGCANSTGLGAELVATGTPFFTADDLGFVLSGGRPNQPSLLVQGEAQQSLPFKDGLFCLANPTERVEVIFLDAGGGGASQSSIVTNGAVPGPGVSRYYQQWYRDPQLSPCGTGSNFSNGVQVNWI